ncbi:outer membrane beta-barrel protein [Nonlabens xiamenensis]|uniref:outer membrane beta-barrel protein n=1 Tax=Nonlabens xiamenensis TaxID=2341043 RepID=UPI000F6116A4|nr:outer membrane beta-barrel protein [Nonlabens xiamenensis]
MRLWIAVITTMALTFTCPAQQFNITGTVQDSLSREKLQSATVFLESVSDSTLITYSITDADGKFNLTGNTGYEQVNFYTSYQGYQEYTKALDLSQGRDLDLGVLSLNSNIEALDGVTVVARKAPVTIKQDTLEFNAKSFNTKADATLEDVISELPGVEVDKDGQITVNGKEVSKILVNGKEFFGDDPKIALKNLPKEIIDKIQVTESKTDAQKATGEDGDANVSEINITIDEDKNKGWFSRLTLGGGTDDRYSMSGIANYFNKDFKVSVLGSSNNINSPGFSFDEIYDAMGSSAYSVSRSSNGSFGINGVNFGGGGGGITSSKSGGVNLSNDWGEVVEMQLNYFYGGNNTVSARESRRTTFLPDRSFNTNSTSNGKTDGMSHRISGRLEVKPDTLTSISIRPNINLSDRVNSSSSNATATASDGSIINTATTSRNSDASDNSATINLNFSRRTKEKGTYYGVYGNLNRSINESSSDFNSVRTTFDDAGNQDDQEVQNQLITENGEGNSLSITPNFTKKISEVLSLSASYNLEYGQQENIRSVFDRDGTGGEVFNPNLSNDYRITTSQNRPSLGLRYKKDKLRINLDMGIINQALESEDALLDNSFDKEFTDPYIRAYVNYKFGKFGRAYINYRNSIGVPAVRQLQPVEDRTNPQNIVVGNPDLDASQRHNIYFNLSKYDWEKGSGFYAGGGFTYTDNRVAAITTTDDNLIRTTTYRNIDGIYSGYMYANYRKSWKKDDRTIGFRVGMNADVNFNKGFSNGVAYESDSYGLSPGLDFNYEIKDIFDLDVELGITQNSTQYSIGSIQEQDFLNQNAAIDLTTYWPENVILGLRGEYNKFGNVSDEFDNDSFVLIGSLGYKFAKDKAVVKLKAYDILNEVINTRRTITDDFVADTSSLVLQQYFMLSFTYKFSKFGGKDPNKG